MLRQQKNIWLVRDHCVRNDDSNGSCRANGDRKRVKPNPFSVRGDPPLLQIGKLESDNNQYDMAAFDHENGAYIHSEWLSRVDRGRNERLCGIMHLHIPSYK